MKKWLLCLLLLIVVVGCTNQEPVNGHDSNPDNVEETPANGNDGNDDQPNQNGNNKPSFDMSKLKRDDLKEGKITGLPFEIGDDFREIRKRWGIPVEEDYMRGGKFSHYQVGGYDFYFFDAELDIITGIQINPRVEITMDQIRDSIGEADYDGLDDLSANAWSLTYHFDDYTLFFTGTSEDRNATVLDMFLKREQ